MMQGLSMKIIPIKIEVLQPPQDDLLSKIKKARLRPQNGDVIAITSKVVSIWQGRSVLQSSVSDKDTLIKKEADGYLERKYVPGRHVLHTIKNSSLIASAGIDTSNAGDYYILWPREPKKTADKLLQWFKKTYRLKRLGLIITDSRSMPLRRGIVGFALSYAGFEPLYDYRGTKDLFGRKFAVSQQNLADALAASAVLAMGEGREQTPLALVRGAPHIRSPQKRRGKYGSLIVPMREDIFAPFLKNARWRKGGTS